MHRSPKNRFAVLYHADAGGRLPHRYTRQMTGKPDTRLPVLHGCDPDNSGRVELHSGGTTFMRGQA